MAKWELFTESTNLVPIVASLEKNSCTGTLATGNF